MADSNRSLPEVCPICDGEEVETDVYGLNGICLECGFVLQADSDAIPDWASPDADSSTGSQEDWITFCRVENATEQQLAEAFGEIETIATRFELPTELREKTADIYCRAFRAEATDGRDTSSMIAACLRVASLQATKPIPTGRLTEHSTVESSKFRLCYSVLQSDLDLTASPVEPVSYLWFLRQMLSVSPETVETTTDLLASVNASDAFVGKDPAGVAGAGLYCAAESFTQQTIADTVGVSAETIRLRAADLTEATA